MAVVLHPADIATAAALRAAHGMDPGLRGDDLLLQAGQEPLALGQGQTQGGQVGEVVGLGNPQNVGAVLLPRGSGAHQSHDPGHVVSTSTGKLAQKYSSWSYTPNLAAVPTPCPKTSKKYDEICADGVTKINNGAAIYIGAPAGVVEKLAACLTGKHQKFNECDRPSGD